LLRVGHVPGIATPCWNFAWADCMALAGIGGIFCCNIWLHCCIDLLHCRIVSSLKKRVFHGLAHGAFAFLGQFVQPGVRSGILVDLGLTQARA